MSVNVGTATAYIELDASKFTQGLRMCAQQIQDFNSSTKSTSEKLTTLGGTFKTMGASLTKTFTLPLLAVGAGAIKTASDFEAGMSKVSALSGATGDDLKMLEDKAREMGASTKYSATESAEALSYMALN